MDGELKAIIGIVVAVLVLFIGLAWFSASVEAKTYNRITGSDVTTWEAMWIELRVDCN